MTEFDKGHANLRSYSPSLHRVSPTNNRGQVKISIVGFERILEKDYRRTSVYFVLGSDKLDEALWVLPIAPDYEASRARGFVLRLQELQSLA
ncbi:hypothetical protein Tco_0968253 [Tanacetum coccineum]